ncbi:MAG: ATP-binding protein [Desulfitobacteriia bacterium]|jgi:MinD superfamily P-loop ATPase
MQLTVISGKGGTGKTTIAVAISELERSAKVDCDVDAPNLYLYYQGQEIFQEGFSGGKQAVVDQLLCSECGICQTVCKFEAIVNGQILPFSCEGCGACVLACPEQAIELREEITAQVLVTRVSDGILSHSRMEIGSEGSGKLITILRKKAQEYAEEELIINDGSPGIGCPVISSLTATDAALIVTEPTQSGLEDLQRIATLCRQFKLKTFVCINKADINEEMSAQIEAYCKETGLIFSGRIPYDETVLKSINELKPIIYYENSLANQAIRAVWDKVRKELFNC